MIGPTIRDGVRRLFRLAIHRPADAATDADAELQSMIDERVAFLVSRGATEENARAEAVRHVGKAEEARERVHRSARRRERMLGWRERIGDTLADIRHSLRSLRRSPAMATAAAATLALAIGATATMFAAVEAVILRPLPFHEPDRLVSVWEENPDFGWYQQDAAPANMLDWKEQVAEFADVAGYPSFGGTATLTGSGAPRLLNVRQATGNFFDVLGVPPYLGRTLRPEETWSSGGPRVVVLSYQTWRDVFGSDRGIVGTSIPLDGSPVEVVGVLPERFAFPGIDADLWEPVRFDPNLRSFMSFRRAHWFRTVARLKPGVDVPRANGGLRATVARLQREYPATNTRMGAGITPLQEILVGPTRLPLLVLLGSVALLLLIACANIANLLLVRASSGEREAAVRLALGAGKARIVRQALIDSIVLAIIGGVLGVAAGAVGARLLSSLLPPRMLPVESFEMNWLVAAVALVATTVSALISGTGPAAWLAGRAPSEALREGSRSATIGPRGGRLGSLFLVAQVALALILTVGATLLIRSYIELRNVDPGFDPRGVLTATVNLPDDRYDDAASIRFFEELVRRARELPGVDEAGYASRLPLGNAPWTSTFAIAGRPPMEPGLEVLHREISADYHRVMRVPLLQGRYLEPSDRAGAPLAVLVNATLARLHFPGQNPIGQRVAFDRVPDSTAVWRTIVGVVGDERQSSLGTPARPEFLAPHTQDPRSLGSLIVRTRGEPGSVGPGVRALVSELDPLLALSSLRPMESRVESSLARDRFLATLLLGFAVIGLVLGLVGVYGIVAQLTARRAREMAIRIALGARRGEVQWLVLRGGLTLAGAGIAVGIGVALLATGVLRSLLYGVAPVDPFTFMMVPALILITAALASWLPAARASRADPTTTLRAD